MVRVVSEVPKIDSKAGMVLKLLGIVIAERPAEVKKLLEKHRITVSAKPQAAELTAKVMLGIEKGGGPFHTDLAGLLSGKLEDDQYFSFDPISISAISGAIGSIASVFGAGQQRKLAQQQASAQTMDSIMQYKAAQEMAQQMAEQRAIEQQSANEQAEKNRKFQLQVAGGLGLLAVVGFLIYTSRKAQPKQQSQNMQIIPA